MPAPVTTTIYTTSLSNLSTLLSKNGYLPYNTYAIVRNYKNPISGVHQLSALAPSGALYAAYYRKLRRGEWNEEAFRDWYAPRFRSEMQSFEAQLCLQELAERNRTSPATIILACFCSNARTCHRTLIGEILTALGAHVQEGGIIY